LEGGEKFSEKPRERDEGRSKRESQGFFLAFEMGNFLDSRSSYFWSAISLKSNVRNGCLKKRINEEQGKRYSRRNSYNVK